jgi:hypothetical protein
MEAEEERPQVGGATLLSEGRDVTEREESDALVRFASRRALPSGLYESRCKGCLCRMSVDAKRLVEEFRGSGPWCWACSANGSGSYGGSPQEAHDHAYHGGRFHSAEW